MRHLLLLPFLLFFLPAFAQHRPDSVIWNGEWHYIYPIPEQLKASPAMLQRTGLMEEEFELYRVWYKKNDPRKDLEGKALYSALKQELIASKRMTESGYDEERKRFRRVFSRPYRCRIRTRGSRYEGKAGKIVRIKRFAALFPEILVTDELRIDNSLVPYIGELPDGKYIQYFDLFFSFAKQKNMVPLPPKVACVFSLSDNHPEGSYLRLAYNGDTLSSGVFAGGRREGNWRITHEYRNGLNYWHRYFHPNDAVNDYSWLEIDFRNGVPDGAFRSWSEGRLLHTGELADGKMTGSWNMRLWNWESTADFPQVRFEIGNDADSLDWPENRLTFFQRISTDDGNGFRFSGAVSRSSDFASEFMYGLPAYNRSINWKYSLKELDIRSYDIYREQRYEKDTAKWSAKATWRSIAADWNNGKPGIRYRLDPVSRGVLGASFYKNGQLFDTIGYDPLKREFFRWVYDLDGKLYYERLSDSLGQKISEVYFNEAADRIVWVDGVPAVVSGWHLAWENPEKMLTGNRRYLQKLWYARSQRLCNDIYVDTVAGVHVYTAYNGLEQPYFQKTTKLAVHFHPSEELPDGDSLIISEYTWGKIKIRNTISHKDKMDYYDRRFFFEDRPYTGSFTMDLLAGKCAYSLSDEGLRIGYNWKELGKREYKRSTKREDRAAGLAMHDSDVATDYWSIVMNVFAHHSVEMDNVYSYSGHFENGTPAGEWIFFGKHNKELFRLHYVNGLPSGTVRNFAKLPVPGRKAARKNKYRYRFGPTTMSSQWQRRQAPCEYELKNGQPDGRFVRFWHTGDTMEFLHYRDGLLHGKQEVRSSTRSITGTYDNGKRSGEFLMVDWNYASFERTGKHWYIDTICRFRYVNDELNGTAMLNPGRYSSEHPYVTGSYRDDKPEGEMAVYDNATHELVEKLFFENALLLRREFYTHGELSYFFEFPASDSIRIVSQLIRKKSFEMNLSDRDMAYYGYSPVEENVSYTSFLDQRRNSVLTRFYPNGNVARKGPLLRDTKTGHWDYFNYDGQRLYSIDYVFPEGKSLSGGDRKIIGYYTEYDTLGNEISKRAVTEEIEKYNCSHDEYYAIRQYITLEDPDDGIERTNGTIRNYFDNGMLMSEGLLVDGLPTGVWKFYTPDGKLHIVGRYEKGLKEGRWLTGDLTDRKYIGDICLDPDDPLLDFHVAQMERELAISVALYKGGVLQAKQEYDIHKND